MLLPGGLRPPQASNSTQQGEDLRWPEMHSFIPMLEKQVNENMGRGARHIWVQVPAWGLAGCVILSSELVLSESGFLPW